MKKSYVIANYQIRSDSFNCFESDFPTLGFDNFDEKTNTIYVNSTDETVAELDGKKVSFYSSNIENINQAVRRMEEFIFSGFEKELGLDLISVC